MEKQTLRRKTKKNIREQRMELVIIGLCILCLLFIGLAIFFFCQGRNNNTEKNKPIETATVVNQMKVPDDVYYSKVQKTANVNFSNPEGNQSYVVYSVILKDTKETLFTSPYLAPGQSVEQFPLSLDLPLGDYEVTVKCDMYLLSDKTPIGGTSNNRTLHVEQ